MSTVCFCNSLSNVNCCICLLKYVAVKLQVRLSSVGVILRDTELKLVFGTFFTFLLMS